MECNDGKFFGIIDPKSSIKNIFDHQSQFCFGVLRLMLYEYVCKWVTIISCFLHLSQDEFNISSKRVEIFEKKKETLLLFVVLIYIAIECGRSPPLPSPLVKRVSRIKFGQSLRKAAVISWPDVRFRNCWQGSTAKASRQRRPRTMSYSLTPSFPFN